MWTRIRKLLVGIVSTLNVKSLDTATVRAAMIAALVRLAEVAKATPSVWDDLVLAAALTMIRDDAAWAMLFEWLKRMLPAVDAAPTAFGELTDADLESRLAAICLEGAA